MCTPNEQILSDFIAEKHGANFYREHFKLLILSVLTFKWDYFHYFDLFFWSEIMIYNLHTKKKPPMFTKCLKKILSVVIFKRQSSQYIDGQYLARGVGRGEYSKTSQLSVLRNAIFIIQIQKKKHYSERYFQHLT